MKALSLWRPWSALCVIGAKEYETRSWSTNYRGPLAIQSTKTVPREVFECVINAHNFNRLWSQALVAHPSGFQLLKAKGAIIGTVELVDVVHVEEVVDGLSEQERAFGNFSPGRYAWKFTNPQPLETAIPARGAQGLWNWRNDA